MVRSRSNLDEFNKIEINFDRILIIRKGGGGEGKWRLLAFYQPTVNLAQYGT